MFRKIAFPSLVFLTWRLLILIFQIFIQPSYLITVRSSSLVDRLFNSWTDYWDAEHYIGIASESYHFPDQAFFPLWPAVVKLFTNFHLSYHLSGFLLTIVLGFLNFVLFYFLAEKLIGIKKAKWALIFFSCFPATFFLHANYSENLFLFFTLLSFWFLEQKKFFFSAISGGFATAARLAGLALVSSYLFLKTDIKNKILMIMVGSLGLVFYMIFLQINYGDFLLFIKGQLQWCQNAGRCGFTFPLLPLFDYAKLLILGKEKIELSFRLIDFLSSIVFLSFIPLVWKKLPKHYLVYSLVVILMPLSSGSITSMVRIVLTAFPIFFVIPDFLKSNWSKMFISFLLFLFELHLIARFSSYLWVA